MLKFLCIFRDVKIIRQYQWVERGPFTVCKTVYTSSILVVASINIINALRRLVERP